MTGRELTADLLTRLERHYIKRGADLPGGVFLPEVTYGGAGGQRADALYVGFTSTSGRILIGHELKVTRADWRRELEKSGKADAWADECHAWYVVAPSTDVVRAEELPNGWGLLVINPRTTTRLDVAVKATMHLDRTPSWTATRSLLSRADMLRARAIWDAEQRARAKACADVEEQVSARVARETRRDDADKAQATLRAVCDALGVRSIETTYGDSPAGGAFVTLTEIRDAAAFLRAHRDIASAARALRSRYGDPIERTRARIAALEESLNELQALTVQATAEEAHA